MFRIRTIYQQNKIAYVNLNNIQLGGAKKWFMFSNKQRNDIMKAYNEIILSDKNYKNFTFNKLYLALSGIYIESDKFHKKSKKNLFNEIYEIYKTYQDPIIHEDSLTSWCNQATEKYGLTIGDVKKMKFGDTIELIMFDRNMGEHINDYIKKNDKYNPTKIGCVYATYIHGSSECLSGLLKFHDIDVIHTPFKWEINLGAIKNKCCHDWFWGPLTGCDLCKNITIKPKDLDDSILVGWRGPCIRKIDAKKLPKYVVHYDTWWDDSVPFKYHNYLKKL